MSIISKSIDNLYSMMRDRGYLIHTSTWQGMDISKNRGAEMVELLNPTLNIILEGSTEDSLKDDIKPNLPWADNHFKERVCGLPINPGIEWENWPWSSSAKDSLDCHGMFNHNYMERYWPKNAVTRNVIGATKTPHEWLDKVYPGVPQVTSGIGGELGDLGNLVSLMVSDPLTRQAYLPVWFPEDTGDANTGRKPCTLGYHFIIRGGYLHTNYYIRSCDLYRHFRDDVYLTARLSMWLLEKLRYISPEFNKVELGVLRMNITSLHMFIGDYQKMFGKSPEGYNEDK